MIFLCSFNRNKCYLVICMTEVNLKAKAEMSIFVLVILSAGNVLYLDLKKKKLKTDVAKMIMLNSSKLSRDTNKHRPATG